MCDKTSYIQILKKEKEQEEQPLQRENIINTILPFEKKLKYNRPKSMFKKSFSTWRNIYKNDVDEIHYIFCINMGIDYDDKIFYERFYNTIYNASSGI